MRLYNVLYVPEIAMNLTVTGGKGAEVSKKTMNIGHLSNSNLYVINTEPDFANVALVKHFWKYSIAGLFT